jgi:hypothetical protein
VKVTVIYDSEIGMPRVSLFAETDAERQDLELLAAFDDVRFSYEIEDNYNT